MEATLNLLLKDPPKFSRSNSSLTFVIDTIGGDSFRHVEPPPHGFVISVSLNKKLKDDRQILQFQDHKKMDRTLNVTLRQTINATIIIHYVLGILVDYRGSYNLSYFTIFIELGLSEKD